MIKKIAKNKCALTCRLNREDDEVIRIISARRANKFEQSFYKG